MYWKLDFGNPVVLYLGSEYLDVVQPHKWQYCTWNLVSEALVRAATNLAVVEDGLRQAVEAGLAAGFILHNILHIRYQVNDVQLAFLECRDCYGEIISIGNGCAKYVGASPHCIHHIVLYP